MNALITAMAVHRLSKLITEDEIMRPVRERVFAWAEGSKEFSPQERVATLIECIACMSVWSAAGILVASQSRVGRWLAGILAASDAALGIEAIIGRLER